MFHESRKLVELGNHQINLFLTDAETETLRAKVVFIRCRVSGRDAVVCMSSASAEGYGRRCLIYAERVIRPLVPHSC